MATRSKAKAKEAVKLEPATLSEVREWGNANGFTVAAKGRIASSVVEAFTAATGRPLA